MGESVGTKLTASDLLILGLLESTLVVLLALLENMLLEGIDGCES